MFKDRLEWTKEEIDYVIKNFGTMSPLEMSKHIDRNKKAIQIKLCKMGYKKDKENHCNQNYFDNIDTPEKAYWLGFIYADGNIYISKYENTSYCLGIELSSRDKNHLKNFNKAIESNFEIRDRIRILKDRDKQYTMSSLRIYNKSLIQSLQKNGVSPNKSMIIKFPTLDDIFISHFVRGFFDGDGSISIEKRSKQLRCNFASGSFEFLESIGKELKKMNISYYIGKSAPNSRCYQLGITGRNSNKDFLEYIYNDAEMFLARKYNHYIANKNLLEYVRKGWDKSK